MSRHRGILFDIDGTLIDSNWQHAIAWARALNDNGYIGITTATAHHAIGMASDLLLTELIGADDEAVAKRHDELMQPMTEHIVALPGAAELLAECKEAGYTTALVTSATEKDLKWMLPLLGGESAVSDIISAADVDESKPSPEPFEVALQKIGLPAADCVAVGDSVWDMKAAINAKIAAIGLTCGGTPSAELIAAGATVTFDDPFALLERMRANQMRLPV